RPRGGCSRSSAAAASRRWTSSASASTCRARGQNGSRQMNDSALPGPRRGPLGNLWRRIALTYRYLGWRTLAFRVLTFPLRFTPLGRRLRLRSHVRDQELRRAVAWYREQGRPVDIVIPSYRDAARVRAL